MFRELIRKKLQLSEEECLRILTEEPRGVLSVLGDDDYPYGMPMNFWYDPQSGHLFFHGGKEGHKIDALKKHGKVSFCVYDQGFRKENDWALNIKSVIVFGRMEFVADQKRAMEISRNLSHKYTQDNAYIEHEIVHSGPHTLCLELIPEHICGKLVNES
ncbi:MAG: pyridoxamine 5'-phosphate oxidase family protein [Firmicutes bacterium]|nr:pyridoxamine 5'-phosphate oxidase family protein [Bacillota bacterium]